MGVRGEIWVSYTLAKSSYVALQLIHSVQVNSQVL